MTTALIIFSIAMIVAGIILLNKKKEVTSGVGYFSIGNTDLDQKISDISTNIEIYLIETDSKKVKSIIKKRVVRFETWFLKSIHLIAKRFEVYGDVVTGRDIPKNRGSISFFLKNIENDKKGRLQK